MAANPPHLRPFGYTTKQDERKEAIFQTLRASLTPMTRQEIEVALGWPDNSLHYRNNKSVDPIMLLMEEGRVGRVREGPIRRYFADPDVAELIVKS